MLVDPTAHLYSAPRASPERLLSAAVLHRAVLDLFMASQAHGDGAPTVNEQKDNLRFLTSTSGVWAKMRHEHCAIADIDPDIVRETVLRWLHDEDDGHLLSFVYKGRGRAPSGEKTKAIFFAITGDVDKAAKARAAQARAVAKRREQERLRQADIADSMSRIAKREEEFFAT